MAEISASMVMKLRAKTDAPMMECKKALTEAAGDMDKAEELLRVRLGNKATKAATRIAAEGVVAIEITDKVASVIEVNCETDFVAKNDDFLALVRGCAKLIIDSNPADVAALSALELNGQTVEQIRADLVGKIGENMAIRRFIRRELVGKGTAYIHAGSKIGVLVDISGGDEALAKDVAMHIAANKPVALSAAEVPAELIAKERSVAELKAAESGKPAEIVAKMVDGSIAKYLKEVALLSQPFVKDDKQTIEQVMKANGATINSFSLVIVGEGIEKKVVDFAAEVAEAARG